MRLGYFLCKATWTGQAADVDAQDEKFYYGYGSKLWITWKASVGNHLLSLINHLLMLNMRAKV